MFIFELLLCLFLLALPSVLLFLFRIFSPLRCLLLLVLPSLLLLLLLSTCLLQLQVSLLQHVLELRNSELAIFAQCTFQFISCRALRVEEL